MSVTIGHRHHPKCNCGCQWVEGLVGRRVEDSDTPKLAEFGLQYVEFQVPSYTCGEPKRVVVCYDR